MNRIFFLGDLHGDWRPVRELNRRLEDKLDLHDTIVLLGDAGLNFYLNERDNQFKNKLSKFNCRYFVIRGNHEERPSICAAQNPDKWEHIWYSINNIEGWMWVEKNYPHIFYAEDNPSEYDFIDYKTLVIPGAYSVDKEYRLMRGWTWFPQEQLTLEERIGGLHLVDASQNYDLVLSHTCPIDWEPVDLFLPMINQLNVDKTMEEYLAEIEYKINYKAWLWGHYHAYREYGRALGPVGYENPRRIMLFNHRAIEINDLFTDDATVKWC